MPSEREQIEKAVAALEAQRAILGDAAVEAALAGLRQRLTDLERAEVAVRRRYTPPAAFAGERKLVTVMFADISGFTALAEKRDPEAVRELMNECFDRLVPIVERYEGTVDKFIGDEIMALFGAPVAHENDPERALRAALDMMAALNAFNGERRTDLGMHIGINTGLVIAGDIGSEGRQQYSVMGDPVNVAAFLKDTSERGTVLVGPDTYRLTDALFDFDTLDPVRVKGKTEPVVVYRVVGLKAAPARARGIGGLRSPLVGRNSELKRLKAALDALRQGQGGIVAVVGEAGLGKSRLVAESRQTHGAGISWAEGRALSYTQGVSYGVARDVLCSLLGVPTDAPSEVVGAGLRREVENLLSDRVEDIHPYLAYLLDLALNEAQAEQLNRLTPKMLQVRLLRAFCEYVQARSARQPLVMVWEDLHWADVSSLNLLEAFRNLTGKASLLLLLLCRPEGERIELLRKTLTGDGDDHGRVIQLEPLSHAESRQLVSNLLAIDGLPEAARQVILEKVEGNPFFMEEVLRSLLDAGRVVFREGHAVAAQSIREIDVPDTVNGVIAARIDRLTPQEKRTLQTASVIGRVFPQRVLAHILGKDERILDIEASLSELLHREFIRRRTVEPSHATGEQEFIFKHVLTRDVAYGSLLMAERKVLHQQAGEAIEALVPEQLDERAATLAHHFEHAGIHDKAVVYLGRAGERAVRLSANEEAIDYFHRALDSLNTQPGSPERDQRELELQFALATPLKAAKGWGSEVRQAYERAQVLCERIGETPHRFNLLWLLREHRMARAEHRQGLDIGGQMLELAQHTGDPIQTALAHLAIGTQLEWLGDFAQSLHHLDRTHALNDPSQCSALVYSFGHHPGVYALNMAVRVLWFLGYPDQARRRGQRMLEMAREINHPFTSAFAMTFSIGVYRDLGDLETAKQLVEDLVQLQAGEGFVSYRIWVDVDRGLEQVAAGNAEEGLGLLRRGMEELKATGVQAFRTYFLTLLAEACGQAGRIEEGLGTLDEATAIIERTDERYREAEVHRRRGELLLLQGDKRDEAEACFHQAIGVARRQQAKSLELRATMSLCRLLQQQGKQGEARSRLSDIYDWFTEGFDTPDLQDAKALLDELSGT